MKEYAGIGKEPKPGKIKLIVLLTVGLLILTGIMAFVIILIVRDKGPGASDPTSLVRRFINAVEGGDVDAYFDCFDPDVTIVGPTPLEEINPELKGYSSLSEEGVRSWFDVTDIEFNNEEIELNYGENNLAVFVQLKKGEMIISAEDGEYFRDLDEYPLILVVVIKDGRYYMDNSFLIQWYVPDMDS